jgi:ATP-dependent 26S proteasome regulatory subunit
MDYASGTILNPGRFDRVVGFRPPDRKLCASYIHGLSREASVTTSATSIVEMRGDINRTTPEAYIFAGGLAFDVAPY